MSARRSVLSVLGFAALFAIATGAAGQSARTGYSYVRDVNGEVTVNSRLNGEVAASRNMPISSGDEVVVSEAGRAEIGLADGNVLYLGGGTRARFDSIRGQQGEDADYSKVNLEVGSLVLAAVGAEERAIPRIDTEDATVYLSSGARARINYDPNHGTVVVSRAGTAEVRTREGSYRVKTGDFLMVHGDEEPEIQRGAFSRDRFDLWVADRYQSGFETKSVSAQYVEQDSSDVVALDGYGDWSYNETYGSNVWRPNVPSGWSPYSNGSWYYTPAGLTWWSNDPWGWYPFHYGNWFFDASFSGWCWAPSYVYSPAWVYFAYSPGYVGWCPAGWYGFYSPWCANYYRQWGWTGRSGVYLSVHGTFPARSVDFRGWNFTGSNGFGSGTRMDVIPGARIGGRVGGTVAISSRPIVVPARPGEARSAVQGFVREAPRLIERTSTGDSTQLGPVLARERALPASSQDALRNHAVVADRGRLTGPGVADIAARGTIVDRTSRLDPRGGDVPASSAMAPAPGRSGEASPGSQSPASGFGRSAPNRIEPHTVVRGDSDGVQAVPSAREDWRGSRPSRSADGSSESRTIDRGDSATSAPSRDAATSGDWRSRPRSFHSQDGRTLDRPRATDDWRSRPSLPPARRVIEGSVPGRRPSEWSGDPYRRDVRTRDDRQMAPQSAPAPSRNVEPAPRPESRRESAPSPQREMRSAPSARPAPAPAPVPHGGGGSGQPRPH